MKLFWALGAVAALVITARCVADEAVWIGPATGDWKTAANWSTGVVPTNGSSVRIDDNPNQNTRVEIKSFTPSPTELSIDAGDTLAIISSQISLLRPLTLDGTLSVEGTNSSFGATVVVSPTGEIRLVGTTATGATATVPGLRNEGTIHGGGVLSLGNNLLPSWNESTIRADNPTIPLTVQTQSQSSLQNDGTLAATGGGKLQIQRTSGSSANGVRGGRIEAYPNSTVVIGSTNGSATGYVEDSVLATMDDTDPNTAAPLFQFGGAELKNVTLQGKIAMGGASIIGTLTNQADLSPSTATLSGPGTYHNLLEGDTLLKGGGTISLDAIAMFGSQTLPTTSYKLINADNSIHGSGELAVSWLGFTNRGVVQADAGLNKELYFYNGQSTSQLINSGVMKAINGGRLRLGYTSGATAQMKNFEGADAGEIVAGENSSVLMNTIQIQGGVLRTEGSDPVTRGKFIGEPGVILQDLTLDGTFRMQTLSGVLSTIGLLGTIRNTGSWTTRLSVGASAELTGGGEIISEAGTFLTLGSSASLTNDDNVIHGIGTISGAFTSTFTNRGTFRAEGGTLGVLGQNSVVFVNSGLLDASAGATLAMSTISTVQNYEGGLGGTIHAAAGGVVTAYGIDGGTVATDGDGVVKVTNLIKDLHNTGTIQTIFSVIPQGTIVNDGLITGSTSLSGPFVRFDGSGRWEGASGNFGTGTLVNGPHHTISVSNNIGINNSGFNTFENEGTLESSATVVAAPPQIYAGSFENTGLVHTAVGKVLAINSSFSRASNFGTLLAEGNLNVTSPYGLYNENGGVIDVRATLTLSGALRNRVGGTIAGNGQIARPIAGGLLVANEGVVDPGPDVGTLTVGGDFQHLATGQLKIDVSGGAAPLNDLLQINGAASLAGSLLINHLGSEALVAGNSFTFLAATAGVTGAFSQVTLPALDPDLFWYIDYEPNSVRALVADVIPGDFNRNGSVGAEDYVLWRNNAGTPEQYDDWIANFGKTIDLGGAMSAAQAPEPASALLLFVGSLFALARPGRSKR